MPKVPSVKTITPSTPYSRKELPGTNKISLIWHQYYTPPLINLSNTSVNSSAKTPNQPILNNKQVVQKWSNMLYDSNKEFADAKQCHLQGITQFTLNKQGLKADSRTVNNSINSDIEQIPAKTTLPPCSEILSNDNKDLLPGVDQITEIISLPPCSEILLGQNANYMVDENTVPSIHSMLPLDIFNNSLT